MIGNIYIGLKNQNLINILVTVDSNRLQLGRYPTAKNVRCRQDWVRTPGKNTTAEN